MRFNWVEPPPRSSRSAAQVQMRALFSLMLPSMWPARIMVPLQNCCLGWPPTSRLRVKLIWLEPCICPLIEPTSVALVPRNRPPKVPSACWFSMRNCPANDPPAQATFQLQVPTALPGVNPPPLLDSVAVTAPLAATPAVYNSSAM